jgi:N6-adenosine-specific RNA methylase IME4
VAQYTKWLKLSLEYAMIVSGKAKFRVMLIDPPYNNTGCKLSYKTMDDRDWLDVINFDDLIDDGLIFMWVTNGKLF